MLLAEAASPGEERDATVDLVIPDWVANPGPTDEMRWREETDPRFTRDVVSHSVGQENDGVVRAHVKVASGMLAPQGAFSAC